MRTSSIRSQDDPLSLAIRPPPEESDTDRQIRLQNEAEARRISERIDEELRFEREKLKKAKSDVKVIPSTLAPIAGLTLVYNSYFSSVRPSQANPPCKSSSNSCTVLLLSKASACRGGRSYISMSFDQLKRSS